ncbi:MAG: crossover junction endodeoxyribonuclease RuvC [actinobacterium acAcidi]|nr:MAG: crossover junction endodeoxyribonuclease RuvC [actinobacterium acAcidi]
MFASTSLVVLGIDPGLTRCGYAALAPSSGGSVEAISMGVLTSPKEDALPRRLALLQCDLEALISEVKPTAIAVEQVFFQNNVRTAMSVGQASGLVLALAYKLGIEVVQYTPSQVKSSVAGSGTANKLQVQKMVQKRLGLSVLPTPADAADAAAVALCHLSVAPLANSVKRATLGAK